MCSLPVMDMFVSLHDVRRISRSKLHKYLIRDKPEEKILNEIQNGPACVYQQTKNGQSPLFLALAKNKENVIKKLLEIYENDFAILKENGFDGDSAVLIAYGADDIAFVEKKLPLLSAVNAEENEAKEGNSVLIMMKLTNESVAYVKPLVWKSEEDQKIYLEIVARLYGNGTFDCNSTTLHTCDNLFIVAAAQGLTWVLEKLTAFGARHDVPNKQMQTAFEFACINNQIETVKWLFETFKIDLLKFMTEGNALFNFANNDCFETFDYILNKIKRTDGDEHIQEIFNRRTEYHDTNVVMQAINSGQYNFATKCLKYDIDLNVVDSSNNNLLHLLLRSYPGSEELCKTIMNEQPKLLLLEDSNQWTPLHLLATRNYLTEFKEIYSNFPSFKNLFFKHFVDSPTIQKTKNQIWCPTPGHQAFNDVVASNFVDMAEFILEMHPDEVDSAEYISGLVILQIGTSDTINLIERFMKLKHFDINVPDVNKVFPLTYALQTRRFDTFNFLLNACQIKDLNLMIDAHSKANLLHSAIFMNPVNVTGGPYRVCCFPRDVDSSDEETDVVDPAFSMPVLEQTEEAKVERVKMFEIFLDLLKRGVDVKNKESFGKTLLHVAVEYDNIEVVRELLKLGLQTDEKDDNGNIPLHFVRSAEVFKALMPDGAKSELVNLKNAQQRTPFMNFVALFFQDDIPEELFDEFMKHSADVNASGNEGYRSIHTAFTIEWIKRLIENGADFTATNHAGENILHMALRNHKYQLAAYLLRQTSIDRFAVTNEGISYLGFTAVNSKEFRETFRGDLKKILMEWVDRFIGGKNVYGGVIINDFITAGDMEVLEHPKADFHEVEVDGQTCLHHAINLNVKVDIVKFLVDKGLDINAVNENGFTPLMFAADYNYTENALFLIEQENVNLNQINAYGFAALHYVARHQNIKVLCKLLAAGADPTILNHDNQTFYDFLSDEDKKLFASYAPKA